MDAEPICHQFQNEINAVIDRYRDQGLTFGEAVGVLETVKLDLWFEQHNDDTPRDPGQEDG